MREGEMAFFAMLPYPKHSLFVGILGVLVDDISGKVEIFWYVKLKVAILGFVVSHIRRLRCNHNLYSF